MCAAVIAATLACMDGAQAEPSTMERHVQWVGTESCPKPVDLEERLHDRLGEHAVQRMGGGKIAVSVHVSSNDDGTHRLDVGVKTARGAYRRTLVDPDCDSLRDAAVLMMVVGIESVLAVDRLDEGTHEVAEVPAPEPAPAARVQTSVSTDPDVEPQVEPRGSRVVADEPWIVAFRAQGGMSRGPASQWTPSFGISVAGQRRRLRVRLDLSLQPERTVTIPDSPANVRILVWASTPMSCFVPSVARFEFPLCAGLELGFVHGVGQQFEETNDEQFVFWSSVVASSGVLWSISRHLFLGAEIGGSVAITRPRLTFDGNNDAFVAEAWGARALLSLEGRFSVTKSLSSPQ